MKVSNYFKSEFKTSFKGFNFRGQEIISSQGFFNRLPASLGSFEKNSLNQQYSPIQTSLATHKITTKANFSIENLSFVSIQDKNWIINDWRKLEDIYILDLCLRGDSFERQSI